MAESSLSIPTAGLVSPTTWYKTRDGLKKAIEAGWTKYGKFFKSAAELSKIPVEMLVAFAAVESNMNPNAQNGMMTGMMQWNRKDGYANAMLKNEFKLGRLSEAEKEILKRKGVKWDANGNFQPITAAQQLDPELNILIGSIYIGQYADSIVNGKVDSPLWGTTDGIVHLDRIIICYNQGAGSSDSLKARSNKYSTPMELANVASGSLTYIKKVMGKNGALDVITSDLKDIVKA